MTEQNRPAACPVHRLPIAWSGDSGQCSSQTSHHEMIWVLGTLMRSTVQVVQIWAEQHPKVAG